MKLWNRILTWFKTKRTPVNEGKLIREDSRDYIYSAGVPIYTKQIKSIMAQTEYIIKYADKRTYNQGQTPMCVSYASKRLKTAMELKDRNKLLNISAGFIYINRVKSDFSYMFNSAGMMIREVLGHLVKEGAVTEEEFSWSGNWRNIPRTEQALIATRKSSMVPQDLWEKAKINKIKSYAKVTTVNEIKAALITEGCGVIINLPITPKFKPGYNESVTKTWAKANNRGYHALVIEGWTRHNGINYWIIRNSWGENWGNGILYYPFDSYIAEAFTTVDEIYKPKYWRIQVGAFLNKDNAQNVQRQLREYGYDTYMINKVIDNKLYYKIQLGAFQYKAGSNALKKRLLDDERVLALKLGDPWQIKY